MHACALTTLYVGALPVFRWHHEHAGALIIVYIYVLLILHQASCIQSFMYIYSILLLLTEGQIWGNIYIYE